MVLALLGLLAHVDEEGRGLLQADGEEAGDLAGNARIGIEKGLGVSDGIDLGAHATAHGCRVRLVQQHAHFTDNGAGLADAGDKRAIADDFEIAGLEHIELAGLLPFLHEDAARPDHRDRIVLHCR